jgi:hypothetical protein
MTFNFFNFNSTLIYVLIDIYYNYHIIGLYFVTIISTIASIILLSSSNSAKTIGKWVVAGGAFEAGSQIVSAGIDAVKEGINSVTDPNRSGGSNSGSSSGGNSSGNTGENTGGSTSTSTSSSASSNASSNTGSSSSTSSSSGGNTGGSSGGK